MALTIIIMQLSKNFRLAEFLASETADRLGIKNTLDVTCDSYIIDNLQNLCKWVLEPVRFKIDCPVKISSGYRCARLNEAVKGSPTSDHQYGLAADIYFSDFAHKWYEVVIFMASSSWIPFDQLIIYKNFLHIGIGKAMRRQVIDYRWR